ncbi:hypothetical protein PanWU01x14_165380, partial [Parasponia andersonii]
ININIGHKVRATTRAILRISKLHKVSGTKKDMDMLVLVQELVTVALTKNEGTKERAKLLVKLVQLQS